MKLTCVFTLCFLLQVSAVTFSQKKVNLNLEKVSLLEVIQELRSQTGYKFFFNHNELKKVKDVSARFVEEELDKVLDAVLGNANLSYRIEQGVIIITPGRGRDEKKMIRIEGRVTDTDSLPLPGVTIVVKGLTIGTATDKDGKYILTIPEMKDLSLRYSFVGMKTRDIKYTGQKVIHVVLEAENKEVDEVVVTGYQRVKKRSMAGSSSSVKAEDLVLNGTQTLEQALQGKLPGMMVINQSGLTGTRQKVRVRGTSTLVGNAEPVWVVDGIIQEDPLPFEANQLTDIGTSDNMDMIKNFVGGAIAWLNPSDIDNIVVLKDASSTAIYGVKAANGVIVITTKKGEKGRMSVSYSGSFSTETKMNYNRMELMNSKQRVDVSREAYERGSLLTGEEQVGYMALALAYKRRDITYEQFNTEVKRLETVNTDWFDILFRTPFSNNHSVSISGGGDRYAYRGSFGISDQNNTAKGNGQRVYRGNVNVSSVFWDQLTVEGGVSGSLSETTGFAGIDPYGYASKTNRAIACYTEEKDLYFYPKGENNYLYNILNELENSGNENSTVSLNANFSLRWQMGEGFVFSSSLGYNYSSSYGELWYTESTNRITAIRGYEVGAYGPNDPKFKNSPLPSGGELNATEVRNNNYTWRNQLEFSRQFGPHAVTAMIGQESRSNKYDGYAQTNYGYIPARGKTFSFVPLTYGVDGSKKDNLLYARTVPTITDRKANYLSFYGNASYMYDDRYAVNASIRMDASNRFGQDRSARYQPVWSVGGRWNVTREHWLADQNILNDVSVRASFGFQGNVAENVGPDLITTFEPVFGKPGEFQQKISKLPTPELKWEKTKSMNLGLDFSILGSKLNGSFEYFTKRTEDMIVDHKVPLENGVASMPINGGNMKNSGWELSLSVVPVRLKDFVWSLGINTSKVYNKVKSDLGPTGDWKQVVTGGFNKDGYPVSSFWAFDFTGLNPLDGRPEFDLSRANSGAAALDVTEYMVYAGRLEPDLTAGLNTSFRYKTLTLSANFYLSTGNQQFLNSPFTNQRQIPSEYDNMSTELLNRWRKPGDHEVTNIPSIPTPANSKALRPFNNQYSQLYPYEAYGYSDIRVVDAWYLRCSNITLSYTLPSDWVSGFAQNMAFMFSMGNPFQIVSSDFKGRDPEVAKGMQPISRSYSLSVNVSF